MSYYPKHMSRREWEAWPSRYKDPVTTYEPSPPPQDSCAMTDEEFLARLKELPKSAIQF